MLDYTAMSRIASGLFSYGTVNSKTLTVAFMEFLMTSDSNTMKSLLLGHGFKDVSPFWGDKPQVPTFNSNPQLVARWPEYQEAMTEVEADWYYLSGHHGRQFASDGEDLERKTHFNTQEFVGFFNHQYHDGRWLKANPDDPEQGRVANEVYMTTSTDDWVYDLGPEDNPLYNREHEDCLGVFLVGCNSLAYRATRAKLAEYFPNAVIIGTITQEMNAIAKLTRLLKEYGRDFLVDPSSYDPEEIVTFLNPSLRPPDVMGVIMDGGFYFPAASGVRCIAPDDPVGETT